VHRALRREGSSWRSVLRGPRAPRHSARQGAGGAAGENIASGAPESVGGGPEPANRPDVERAAARGVCRRRLRLARSLMFTPWFAAGAGVVIAAALAVDSPAALTYAPNGPLMRCPASGCVSPTPDHPPGLTTVSPGVPLTGGSEQDRHAASPRQPGGATAVYQVGYQVVRRWPSGFVAVITLPGNAKPGAWSLELAFPSARVDRVWGARWQPSGPGNAGTARGPWPSHGHGLGSGGLDNHQLMVSATGMPTYPSGCRLDGSSCHFGQ